VSDRWVVGVDIGGTNLVVGVIPFDGGEPAALRSGSTEPERGPDAAMDDVATMAKAVIEETLDRHGGARDEIVGVGIGCPGPLDLARGVVLSAPNLGWTNYPIRDRVAERLGLPATLDNDANCATYGEWWQGAGRGINVLVGVTLGTGIGGGLILDGRLLRGASGSAGELGHTTIDFTGRRCRCGNYGCLEAYVSGPNIAARARESVRGMSHMGLELFADEDHPSPTVTAIRVPDTLDEPALARSTKPSEPYWLASTRYQSDSFIGPFTPIAV